VVVAEDDAAAINELETCGSRRKRSFSLHVLDVKVARREKQELKRK